MRAIVLAAGRGRRLESDDPKCLLSVGQETLLGRMLDALASAGVEQTSLVVGYEAARIRAALEARPAPLPVRTVENPDWQRGSILSLWAARGELGRDDALIMDADVLFPRPLLARLVSSPHPSAFLLDPRAEASGEEMMLAAKGGRVERIARRVDPAPYDRLGEGVGFLKLARADQRVLLEVLAELVEAGELDRDYEDALDRFLARADVRYEEVGDLPWTEIDFAEDLARARQEVLPEVLRLEAEGSRA